MVKNSLIPSEFFGLCFRFKYRADKGFCKDPNERECAFFKRVIEPYWVAILSVAEQPKSCQIRQWLLLQRWMQVWTWEVFLCELYFSDFSSWDKILFLLHTTVLIWLSIPKILLMGKFFKSKLVSFFYDVIHNLAELWHKFIERHRKLFNNLIMMLWIWNE